MWDRYKTLCGSPFAIRTTTKVGHINRSLLCVCLIALLFSAPRFFELRVEVHPATREAMIVQTALVHNQNYLLIYRIVGGLMFYSCKLGRGGRLHAETLHAQFLVLPYALLAACAYKASSQTYETKRDIQFGLRTKVYHKSKNAVYYHGFAPKNCPHVADATRSRLMRAIHAKISN